MKSDTYYMNIALKLAKKANELNEIPVGAVVVDSLGNILGKGYNKKEKTNKAIAHAEIEAITKANKKINNWRLIDCTLYVTLEPCEMCKNVIKESRIKKIIYCQSNNSKIVDQYYSKQIDNSNLIKEYNGIFRDSFNKIR